jgi:hypothetical protein
MAPAEAILTNMNKVNGIYKDSRYNNKNPKDYCDNPLHVKVSALDAGLKQELSEEIKCLHKSVANLRQDIRKIVREEVVSILSGHLGREVGGGDLLLLL